MRLSRSHRTARHLLASPHLTTYILFLRAETVLQCHQTSAIQPEGPVFSIGWESAGKDERGEDEWAGRPDDTPRDVWLRQTSLVTLAGDTESCCSQIHRLIELKPDTPNLSTGLPVSRVGRGGWGRGGPVRQPVRMKVSDEIVIDYP